MSARLVDNADEQLTEQSGSGHFLGATLVQESIQKRGCSECEKKWDQAIPCQNILS